MAISLRAMSYFVTALRHGNIARAAGELNIAASAVSAAIDQIEAEFDLTLVTRQRARGIQGTANGLAIARKFERLLEDYRAILTETEDLKQALGGRLRIGYYAPIAPAFLPRILHESLADPGAVQLELEECDNISAQDGLLNGTYDIILFVSEDVRPMISYEVLVEAPAYCLMPRDHPLAGRAEISLAEIAQGPLVVLNRPVAAAYYARILKAQATPPHIAAYASSTEMVRSLVGAGHGCAILNMRPRSATSYGGDGLVALPISDPLPALSLAIAYDTSRPRRLVQHVVEACRAHFADPHQDHCIVTL
ncbi:LysR family transcriptional regulator [Dinoroseobacter sp. S375]|uniref:LysR family transcriptional regulator n=1 Tax=Dinoroseobacter sp. S375 TaxID=3415136 RepID=UPI003C7E7C59